MQIDKIVIFLVIFGFLSVISLLILKMYKESYIDDFENYEEEKQDDGFLNLLRYCLNDKEKAERLIKFEVKRRPELSRNDAVKYAIERIEKDRS